MSQDLVPKQSDNSSPAGGLDWMGYRGNAENVMQEVLDALSDRDCRIILEVTSDDALTANEISEVHDIPLSTTYRKLGLLTEAGLLEERFRIGESGKHTREYTRIVDDIVVSLEPRGETEMRLSRGKSLELTGLSASICVD